MIVFTDCRMNAFAVQALRNFGHTVLPCPPHPGLDAPVASHPDLLLFPADDAILTHADYACTLRALCPALPVVSIPERIEAKYPRDVLLDAALVGKHLVCRPDATSCAVLENARKKGAALLPVRQGYAKCNLCTVSENAVITEDASIAKALSAVGAEVLHVTPGHITLPGYPYGFIGGASGNDGHHVFFCGDLSEHPEGDRIAAFCRRHGKQPVSLCAGKLCDVGSLLFWESAAEE